MSAAATAALRPSGVVGWFVRAVIVRFGALAAASRVGWTAMVLLLETVVAVLARLLVGLLVLVIGSYLAKLASQVILSPGLALVARVATSGVAVALALEIRSALPTRASPWRLA